MDTDGWKRAYDALHVTSSRLEAEISKHQEGTLLKGELEAATGHLGSVFKKVADARQQLIELQALVSGESQPSAAFITALSDRITSYAQQLSSIKQQQRTDYGILLQQEQQLLEELAVLELTLSDEQLQPQHTNWDSPAATHAGDLGHTAPQQHSHSSSACAQHHCQHKGNQHGCRDTQATSASRMSTDFAADCVCRSPDRPCRLITEHSSSSSPSTRCHHDSTGNRSMATDGQLHSSSNTTSSSGLPPEVQAYDAFLARHGASGGWHPDDHATFLAVLKAHRGDYNAALAAAVDALPLQTRQSVIAHCRWHADLCELEMRKRIALVNWRTAKDAAKAAFIAQAVALGDTSNSTGDGLLRPSPAGDQEGKEVRQLKQQLLQQWKQEQLAAREAAAEAARVERRLQQQQERQLRQQRQDELKRQLQEARAAKQQQEQQQAAAAAAAMQAQQSQSSLDPAQKQRLQQRTSAALERRQQLLAAKQEKQLARERKQQQQLAAAHSMRPKVERDPNRLLADTTAAAARAAAAATAAAEAKEAAAQNSRGQASGGFVLHVSHRAVPAWVAGVQGM